MQNRSVVDWLATCTRVTSTYSSGKVVIANPGNY